MFCALQGPELDDARAEQEAQYGYPKADPTKWASCVRVVDPITLSTASVLELDNNEAAISMTLVRFAGQTGANSPMLAVGTVKGLGFYPRAAEGGCWFLHAWPALSAEIAGDLSCCSSVHDLLGLNGP